MSADDLLERIRQRPFVPFSLVTTDGTRYEIRHPELLMPAKRYVVVGIPARAEEQVADRTVILSLLHLQRLKTPALGRCKPTTQCLAAFYALADGRTSPQPRHDLEIFGDAHSKCRSTRSMDGSLPMPGVRRIQALVCQLSTAALSESTG